VCRANTTTAFFFGEPEELLSRYAWYLKNSQQRSWPVGRLRPNALGLFDVHGNAWEWCKNRGDGREPLGSETVRSNDHRVLRGGSFGDEPHYVRSAYRHNDLPAENHYFTSGFRLARTYP
jgi:formylglycine-generating enzyme required for sulfatase activity